MPHAASSDDELVLAAELRAILLERGEIFPAGRRKFEHGVEGMLVDGDQTLSPRIRQLASDLRAEWKELDAKIAAVPKQSRTGGKARLLGISKRGNTDLRTLLIHGARAALLSQSDTPLGRWRKAMIERGVHRNAGVVALAKSWRG